MNREERIIFRAWIKNKESEMGNEMVNVEEIEWDIKSNKIIYVVCSPYEFDIKDVELMQFTGFKDINGKEIFEGDILRSRWTVDGSDEEGFDYYFCELNGQRWLHKKGYTDWSDILGHEEVIGNIYENPELLEVDK